jgi:hypothetical protein
MTKPHELNATLAQTACMTSKHSRIDGGVIRGEKNVCFSCGKSTNWASALSENPYLVRHG